MTAEGTPQQSSQRSRWVFTLNNYDENTNYKEHLLKDEFKIRRAVFGYERGPQTGTKHIQGYLELDRSYRIVHVKRIFPTAYWEAATRSALSNYEYCTKSGRYEVIGDFLRENMANVRRPASVPLILRGLLDSTTKPQVMVSKEYSDRHQYFDKALSYIQGVKVASDLYQKWKVKKLYIWQYQVLKMAKEQNERQVLWIIDQTGNNGKTFLASYMNILYGFDLFDGLVNTRDIGFIMKSSASGYCFDVSRSSIASFDYCCLENIKNGFIVSGKYRGTTRRLEVKPVVVFANDTPDRRQLSDDRWKICTLGEGELSDLTKDAVVSPSAIFPFEEPPTPPDLSEGFDLREYLETRLPPLLRHQEPQRPQPNIHSSQIPERSRIGETNLPPQQQSSVLPLSQDLRSSPPRSARQNQTAYRGIVMRTPPTPSSPPVLVDETEPMRPIICPLHPNLGM